MKATGANMKICGRFNTSVLCLYPMDTLAKTIDFFRIPNPYRELVDIMVGSVAILFFELFSRINVIDTVKSLEIGRLESDLAIVFIAYILGKFLFIFSTMASDLFFAVASSLRKKNFKDFRNSGKKYFEALVYNNRPNVSPEDMEREISVSEIAGLLQTYSGLGVEMERLVSYNRLVGSFSALAFLIGIFPPEYLNIRGSHYFLILSMVLFYLDIDSERQVAAKNYMVYKAAVKEQLHKMRAQRTASHGSD